MFDLFKRSAEPDRRPWGERLKAGLGLSRERLTRPLSTVFGRAPLSEATLEALESALLEADVGVPATAHLLAQLAVRVKRADSDADGRSLLKSVLTELLEPLEQALVIGPQRPFVVMIAGVNGSGKTTSIGKIAKYLQEQGFSVLLAAGDTFRAAAREQLEIWGERNGVPVIAQQGGDPAAVMFDAIAAARARGIDIVLVDTAGRLPTQLHLMEELKKIKRVIEKTGPVNDRLVAPEVTNPDIVNGVATTSIPPHEILLVIDGNTGQNALTQVKAFDDALHLTGLIVTKLDGTAKGGVLAAIAKNRPV